MDGRCSGTQYSDGYGTWDNVVFQATAKVGIRTFEAAVKRSTHTVILPSGKHCNLGTGGCMDSEGGETFWPVMPIDMCHFDQYDILYEGIATRLTPKEIGKARPTIYTVTTDDTTFALAKTSEISVCRYTGFFIKSDAICFSNKTQGFRKVVIFLFWIKVQSILLVME
jgi:hypothetical protein